MGICYDLIINIPERKVALTAKEGIKFFTRSFFRAFPFVRSGRRDFFMEEEKRISVLSVIVEKRAASERINGYLSEYGEYIVGRMGIPYREKQVSVISVVLDAPVSVVNALTGKIGKLEGVTAKSLFGKI